MVVMKKIRGAYDSTKQALSGAGRLIGGAATGLALGGATGGIAGAALGGAMKKRGVGPIAGAIKKKFQKLKY